MEINCLVEGPVNDFILTSLIAGLGKDTSAGGHSLFLGQVRADAVDGKIVTAIEYSAYGTMVNAEAGKIISEIKAEFNDVKTVEIIHSSGLVRAGEISLLVAVSAGHRQQAAAACTKTVELVKGRLPVWKKELFEDGSHEWK